MIGRQRWVGTAGWLAVTLLSATQGVARTIDYGGLSPTEVRACDQLEWQGKRSEAARCFASLLAADDSSLLVQAEAAWALQNRKLANQHFRAAIGTEAAATAARLRWAQLFAEAHQRADAQALYEEVLAADADNLDARLGMAFLLSGQFDGAAKQLLTEVLRTGRGRPDAYLLNARLQLEQGQLDDAEASLEAAAVLIDESGLPTVDLNAVGVGLDYLRGQEPSKWAEKARQQQPDSGEALVVAAHFAVITRQYRQAVDKLRQAIEIQPDHYGAHAELGVNLLRINDFEGAAYHLRLAYQGDPYDPRTVNTLRLLDSLDDFQVLQDPAESDLPGLWMRVHQDEAGVLAPYVRSLVSRSIREFSRRYRFQLTEPVIVELYPNHEDFAVRTLGMPGLGILGVTFGYLVAMDSPSGRAVGEFHWGSTLWHEMAHVFTLKATDHRVPRWFSEGISVYEEWRSGPTATETEYPSLPRETLTAMAGGQLLPIAELDQGFVRPSYPGQVMVSYMQAGLICHFIERQWGFESLVGMLEEFALATETGDAVGKVLKVSPEEFDRRFLDDLQAGYGAVLNEMDRWTSLVSQARKASLDGDWEQAIGQARAAIEIYPQFVESGSPWLSLARASKGQGATAEELAALSRYRAAGGGQPAALRRLAGLLYEQGDAEQAMRVMADVSYAAPMDLELHQTLGDWLSEANRFEEALVEYQVMLALDPHDQAAAQFRVARTHHALGQTAQARTHLLLALEAAPHYRPAQQLLLKLVQGESP